MVSIMNFNVNGIRACVKKGFLDFIEKYDFDIFCLQETKINEPFLTEELPQYPYKYYNFADKKGYSGVSIFSKEKPLDIFYGIDGLDVSNSEGRVLTAKFENYFLVTVYTPNTKSDLSRLDYRHNIWDKAFLQYVTELDKTKPVVICGDLNVAHQEIDLKNFKNNRGKNGFTDEERQGFSNYISNGFVDTFRFVHQDKVQYSWWSYMGNARKNNSGWRIDYFLASEKIKEKIKDALILDQVLGSDHCPVVLKIK